MHTHVNPTACVVQGGTCEAVVTVGFGIATHATLLTFMQLQKLGAVV
jgi:hypothetical protein